MVEKRHTPTREDTGSEHSEANNHISKTETVITAESDTLVAGQADDTTPTINRRKMLVGLTSASALALAGCTEDDEDDGIEANETDDDGDDIGDDDDDDSRGDEFSEELDEFLALQESLGDAAEQLNDANQKKRNAEGTLRSMAVGLVLSDNVELLEDAQFLDGQDGDHLLRELRSLDLDREELEEDEEFVDNFVEAAPETVEEWNNVVAQYEEEAERTAFTKDQIAEQSDELITFWENHTEMFDPEGFGETEIELHPSFGGDDLRLYDCPAQFLDSIGMSYAEMLGLSVPEDVHENIENFGELEKWLAERRQDQTEEQEVVVCAPEACEWECVQASVSIAVGPMSSSWTDWIDDHAWIKLEQTWERECDCKENDTYVSSEEWGLSWDEIQNDEGREINCEFFLWEGDCYDESYREAKLFIYDLINTPESVFYDPNEYPTYSPIDYNCLDWAYDVAEILDTVVVVDSLRDETSQSFTGISKPNRVCDLDGAETMDS